MKLRGIKEITDPRDTDITYPITLLWVDDKGENNRRICQCSIY